MAIDSEHRQYDIAISVVTYNSSPEELAATLLSLQNSGHRLLVTVVDNSPEPRLRQVVENNGAVYVFTGENRGFGAAHNVAIRASIHLAPYHAVINPDVVLEPSTLDTLYSFMEDHPSVGQAMPAVFYQDGREQRLTKLLPTPADLFLRRFLGKFGKLFVKKRQERYEMTGIDFTVARQVPSLSGCFMFLRSTVLQRVGLFDERYFLYMEDVDLCRRIGEQSITAICPKAHILHGYQKGSYSNPRLLFYHLRSAVLYFSKWGWIRDSKRDSQNRRIEPL
ncbi:MAG TPA: glycosyltransferase family 2 protein [Acidobacteriaceae bacterium]